ncbi:Arc family DNA-binding protein [Stutzerimonas nitrititolerans]|uniref:Arc family DNA-binding protein n=1 Tax=Stutzerimonas nitrititolerans TaxID=2482751 RepID=UPI00289FF7B0|nr:Arc family DNA-binding protein [Stutzerimonas nitrititolerans]
MGPIVVNTQMVHHFSMKRTDPQFKLRIPPEVKAALDEAAKSSHRSINAEIVARLKATIDLDEFMAEIKAGTFAEVHTLLDSVLADNDRVAAHGGQTFDTAYWMLDKLLEEKLDPLRDLLSQATSWEKRGDQPSPTAKKPISKRSRPLGMDQEEWDALRRAEIDADTETAETTKPTE